MGVDLSKVGVTKRGLEGLARLRLAGIRQLKGSVGEGQWGVRKVIDLYYLTLAPLLPPHALADTALQLPNSREPDPR